MNKGMNSFVFLVALIAGFAGFLFGFDSSLIADVKDQVMNQLALTDWQWSQVVSISLVGCLLGIPLSGLFADKVSRRFMCFFLYVFIITDWSIYHWHLYRYCIVHCPIVYLRNRPSKPSWRLGIN